MNPRAQGFTLLELLIGMTLVGFILSLLFAGLNLGTRSWEAGEKRMVTSSRQAVVVGFIRRALEQTYLLRWRMDDEDQLAFAGEVVVPIFHEHPQKLVLCRKCNGLASSQTEKMVGLEKGGGRRECMHIPSHRRRGSADRREFSAL